MNNPPRLLVVDDEEGYRDMLSRQLKKLGYAVDTAADGAAGAALAASGGYALAIIDLTMPLLNGLDVLKEIKKASPATAVIMITGFASVETAVYAMQQGASDIILKPFDLDPFLRRVTLTLEATSHVR